LALVSPYATRRAVIGSIFAARQAGNFPMSVKAVRLFRSVAIPRRK
jgi:hypothetical protein